MTSKITSSGYIEAADSKLFYEREGSPDGQTILFVHGLGGTTNSYQLLVPDLQEFDLVRFDWSGHGRSPVRSNISLASYVEDCEAVIDHLRLKNVIVVGHSLGGLIGLHLAAKRPEQIRGLVLFGPVSPPPEAGQKGLKTRASTVRQDGMVAVADAVPGNAFTPSSFSKRRAAVALAREMLARSDPEGYALACEALASSSPPSFEKLKSKISIITGKDDKVSAVAVGQTYCQNLNGLGEQQVLDDVGHWAMLENPEASITAIKQVANHSR